MTAHRSNRLTDFFSTRVSRRTALKSSAIGAVSGLVATSASAQQATPAASSGDPEFLFVQTAASGSFTPNPMAGTPVADGTPTPGGGAQYRLVLEGHTGGTVYFSDRPERIFGDAPTQDFLDGLGFSPINPPNAALVTHGDDGTESVSILELIDPVYDDETETVTYGANLLSDYDGDGLTHLSEQSQGDIPETFDRASLFIDDCPNLTGCYVEVMGLDGPVPKHIGSLPGEPFGQCWEWKKVTCEPCNESWDSLVDVCNQTYSACDGVCKPG